MTLRLLRLAALACACLVFAPSAQAADAVLDKVIALARTQALNGDQPDWPAVEREAYARLAATPGEEGRTSAIRFVLASLKDRHSAYYPPAPANPVVSSIAPMVTAPAARPPIAEGHVLEGGIGKLTINRWSGNAAAVSAEARNVRAKLNDVLASSRCGLIIDVAANTGGNMWPMMSGIAPLYSEGVLETFETRSRAREQVRVLNGRLFMGDSLYPSVALDAIPRAPSHIAVILGPRTMSSGEILAIGFKGQRNVRFFGQPSGNYTTANRPYVLDNGGRLQLTTSRILDRNGTIQQGPVLPDETTDQPLDAARAWLQANCATH